MAIDLGAAVANWFGRKQRDRTSAPSIAAAPPAAPFYSRPVKAETAVDLGQLPLWRASAFPAGAGPVPWLDRPDAESAIATKLRSGEISAREAKLCRKWSADGYVILEGFFSHAELDRTWSDYEAAIAAGTIRPPAEPRFEGDTIPGRVANVHFMVESADRMLHNAEMARIVSLLLGVKAAPFQTIIGHKSSEQLQHSDSIHMTTYPVGYLAANWIAFEDIHPDSGPLIYHPGSHKLPYLFSDELGIAPDPDYSQYHRSYEPAIQKIIVDNALPSKTFLPKKGDALIWHANLLHGGTRLNGSAHPSRKALVCHYFAEGCVCYHDLTGTPSHAQVDQTQSLYVYKRERPETAGV